MTIEDNSDSCSSACLVLMFKAPARSKQRLAATLGGLALGLAERLCACAFEDLAEWPGPVCFAPAGDLDRHWLEARIERGAPIVTQPEGNLGERINHVDRALRALGFARQIFIGIDCPQLDIHYLAQAARLLNDHDAVFGPARDGGVVLMASSRAWPELGELRWSSAILGAQLDDICRAQHWSVAQLEERPDVDTLEDLAPLARQLRPDKRPARRALQTWLAAHDANWQAAPP